MHGRGNNDGEREKELRGGEGEAAECTGEEKEQGS